MEDSDAQTRRDTCLAQAGLAAAYARALREPTPRTAASRQDQAIHAVMAMAQGTLSRLRKNGSRPSFPAVHAP